MKLVERVSSKNGKPIDRAPRSVLGTQGRRPKDTMAEGFRDLRYTVQKRLLETMDLTKLDQLDSAVASDKVATAIGTLLDEQGRMLTDPDRWRLIHEIRNELLGVGPLEPLLCDDRVTDILVNCCRN